MTEQPSEALRLALNEIDRLRRRCLWMTRFFIATSILFWCASDAMFLLRGNVAMGMVFAVITVMTGLFSRRELRSYSSLRKKHVKRVLSSMIEYGGPLLCHGGEDQQESFDSTCGEFHRFLAAPPH